MTDTKLQPGPEADARIARAMGWTDTFAAQCGCWYGTDHSQGMAVANCKIPAYSTTGDGLLAMLEWMQRKPREWEVTLSPVHYGKTPGVVVGVFSPTWDKLAHAVEPTLNLAVAAALRAAAGGEKT